MWSGASQNPSIAPHFWPPPPAIWDHGLEIPEANILHADTQGYSEPVFGLTHLLGIKVIPRMRNRSNVIIYRPEKGRTHRHIDALLTKSIDWALIETHWQDMMQVVLSIQAGKMEVMCLTEKLCCVAMS